MSEVINQYERYAKNFMTLVKYNMHELNTTGVGEGGFWHTLLQEGCGHHSCISLNCVSSHFSDLHSHWMGDGRGEGLVFFRVVTGCQYVCRCACGLNHM